MDAVIAIAHTAHAMIGVNIDLTTGWVNQRVFACRAELDFEG